MSSRCKTIKEVRRTARLTAHDIVLTHIFFHPDFNRWSRSFTGSAGALLRPVADCTASGESHPALKTFDSVVRTYYNASLRQMQQKFCSPLPQPLRFRASFHMPLPFFVEIGYSSQVTAPALPVWGRMGGIL